PLPLQLFWPAQSWPAPLQAPLPLHSFTPSHFTSASLASPWACTVLALARNKPATAVAMTAPFTMLFMSTSFRCQRTPCPHECIRTSRLLGLRRSACVAAIVKSIDDAPGSGPEFDAGVPAVLLRAVTERVVHGANQLVDGHRPTAVGVELWTGIQRREVESD